jgi:hypothetical protein
LKYVMKDSQINPPLQPKKRRPKIVPPQPSYRQAQPPANFILVKLAPDKADKTLNKLKRIKGLCGFHQVHGKYDLVLIIRERNGFDKKAIVKNIIGIPGVVEVQALVAAS